MPRREGTDYESHSLTTLRAHHRRWRSVVFSSTLVWLTLVGLTSLSLSQEIDPRALAMRSDLAKRLRSHVEYLASPELSGRKPGTPGHRKAAAYISEGFREAGLAPLPSLGGFGQTVTKELGENLIAAREARLALNPAPWILLGAHYDHLGGEFLGADDNAAAVAILLEIARSLPPLAHHSVLFVAFNTEEPPYIRTSLMGSQHFVDHLPPEIRSTTNLKAAIIMDLMGGVHWEPIRDAVFAMGAEKSPGLYRHVKETAKIVQHPARGPGDALSILPVGLHLLEELPYLGAMPFSDYDAFRNVGVPFLFLSAGRTPRYHQPTDLPDTLHYERMATTASWLQELLRAIDTDSAPYDFKPDQLEFADEVATLRTIVAKAADWDTSIPNTSIVSHWRLQRDHSWLQELDPAAASADDVKWLERVSIRIQCLLADFPGCFLF